MKKLLLILLMLTSLCFGGVNFPTGTSSTALLSCGNANTLLTGTNPETIGFWIYPTVDNVNSGSAIRAFSRYATGASSGAVAEIDITPTKAVEFVISTGTTNMTVISANNSISLNSLSYIMVITDGSLTAANTSIYVNNSVVGSYQIQTNGSGTVNTLTGTTVYIGNRGDASRPISGNIYELEDWNTKLTATDRSLAYNYGVQGYNMRSIEPQSLQSWWRLNGCAKGQLCSNTFMDEMGLNNCTTLNNPIGVSPLYDFEVNSVMKDSLIK